MSYTVSNEAKAALDTLLENPQVQKAVAFAEADQPRCLEEHIRLTEIEAPTFEESARAEAFAELLRNEGLKDVHIGKGGNVIGTLKGSMPGKKVLEAQAAEMVAANGIAANAAIAAKAIPQCNLVFMDGAEMRSAIQSYYEVLFTANPASIGGGNPDDDFYYVP